MRVCFFVALFILSSEYVTAPVPDASVAESSDTKSTSVTESRDTKSNKGSAASTASASEIVQSWTKSIKGTQLFGSLQGFANKVQNHPTVQGAYKRASVRYDDLKKDERVIKGMSVAQKNLNKAKNHPKVQETQAAVTQGIQKLKENKQVQAASMRTMEFAKQATSTTIRSADKVIKHDRVQQALSGPSVQTLRKKVGLVKKQSVTVTAEKTEGAKDNSGSA